MALRVVKASVLERVGRASARHPLRVFVVRLVALVSTSGLARALGTTFSDNVVRGGITSNTGL